MRSTPIEFDDINFPAFCCFALFVFRSYTNGPCSDRMFLTNLFAWLVCVCENVQTRDIEQNERVQLSLNGANQIYSFPAELVVDFAQSNTSFLFLKEVYGADS